MANYWEILDDVTRDYETAEYTRTHKSYTGVRVYQDSNPAVNFNANYPYPGDPHPYDSALSVTQVQVKGSGAFTGNAEWPYSHAIIRVNYADTLLELNGESLMQVSSGVKIIGLSNAVMEYADGTPLEDGTAVSLTVSQDDLTLYKCNFADPRPAIEAAKNKINSRAWCGYEVGTVLFISADVNMVSDTRAASGVSYRTTYHFQALGVPWNWVPRGSTGLWEMAYPARYQPCNFLGVLGI
jgi:hypothetical protein